MQAAVKVLENKVWQLREAVDCSKSMEEVARIQGGIYALKEIIFLLRGEEHGEEEYN